MQKVTIRKPYQRERLVIVNDEQSMTHESHAASCDINNIVAQFHRTGSLPPGKKDPQYGDVTGLQTDLTLAHQQAVETIAKTEEFTKDYVPKSKRKQKEGEKQKDESDDKAPKNPPPTSSETKSE